MDRKQTLTNLHGEVERIRQSIDKISDMSEISLSELYVAKKCAARFLGICYRTIERWQRQGYIECVRIGGRVYYPRTELLRVACLYSSGIDAVAGSSHPQTLSELLSRHANRFGRRI